MLLENCRVLYLRPLRFLHKEFQRIRKGKINTTIWEFVCSHSFTLTSDSPLDIHPNESTLTQSISKPRGIVAIDDLPACFHWLCGHKGPCTCSNTALPVVPFDLLNLEARKPVIYEGSPIFGDTRLLMFSFNPEYHLCDPSRLASHFEIQSKLPIRETPLHLLMAKPGAG